VSEQLLHSVHVTSYQSIATHNTTNPNAARHATAPEMTSAATAPPRSALTGSTLTTHLNGVNTQRIVTPYAALAIGSATAPALRNSCDAVSAAAKPVVTPLVVFVVNAL